MTPRIGIARAQRIRAPVHAVSFRSSSTWYDPCCHNGRYGFARSLILHELMNFISDPKRSWSRPSS